MGLWGGVIELLGWWGCGVGLVLVGLGLWGF